MRGDCWFYWCWWNCVLSMFMLSFHNYTCRYLTKKGIFHVAMTTLFIINQSESLKFLIILLFYIQYLIPTNGWPIYTKYVRSISHDLFVLTVMNSTFRPISQLPTSIHRSLYCTVHVCVVIQFGNGMWVWCCVHN